MQAGPALLFPKQTEFMPNKLISNAWSTVSRAANMGIRHLLAT